MNANPCTLDISFLLPFSVLYMVRVQSIEKIGIIPLTRALVLDEYNEPYAKFRLE